MTATRLISGIYGFDQIFYGGMLRGSTVLVEGTPGAGKTTLGLEFIYRGATVYDEPGVVLTFEQFPEALYRDALNFGWDLQALERGQKLRVVCTSPDLVLMPESSFLEDVVREIGAKRLLVDSMSHFRQAINQTLRLRQVVYAFINGLQRLGLTSMLVKEQERDDDGWHGFEEFLVDTVVRLADGRSGNQSSRREIEVIKSRGQPHVSGKHVYKITGTGVRIFSLPQLALKDKLPEAMQPVATGIKGLDELLQGGFTPGSGIVVAGEVGTGKTVFGLEFLARGAQMGERGIYLSFEETPGQIAAHADAFDWDFSGLQRQGLVEVLFTRLDETELDELICRLGNYVAESRVRRLVFDTLPDLITPLTDPVILRQKLFYLINYLQSIDCTSLFLYPTTGQYDQQLQIALSLARGNIILKSAISRHQRVRLLEINKLRGVSQVTGDHLLEITAAGLQVFPSAGG